jgi:hypothetical protein
MRALVCPETDVDLSVDRFGGVFQGLSGARSMTTTGHKQRFTLDLTYLTPDEFAWMQALHYRTVPGPYRLLNPFKHNLLSPQASILRAVGDNRTIELMSGIGSVVRDWPAAAGTYASLGMKWSNRAASPSVLRFDSRYKVPVTAGVPVTGSFYAKTASSTTSVTVVLDWYDADWNQLSSSGSVVVTITTSWQRFSVTSTPPAGAVLSHLAILANPTVDVTLAAAQVETGSAPTPWELGGGAPVVLLDQMPTKSPRYPYRSVSLSLLEA